MLIWGGTFTSARLLGREVDPVISAFLRFLIASVTLLLLLYWKEKQFPRVNTRQMLFLIGMGITGIALYNLFFFFGLVHAEASRGSLITATNPLLTAIGAAILFKEKFTLLRFSGFILCVIGAALIISRGDLTVLFEKGAGIGELAFIGCAVTWAAYTLIVRYMSDNLSSLAVITYASCIGTLILFFVMLFDFGFDSLRAISNLSFTSMLHLLYLSILATVLGFVWFQEGIKQLGAAKAAVFIYAMPISALFWAFVILDERITLSLLIGALMIISGIYLVNKKSTLKT